MFSENKKVLRSFKFKKLNAICYKVYAFVLATTIGVEMIFYLASTLKVTLPAYALACMGVLQLMLFVVWYLPLLGVLFVTLKVAVNPVYVKLPKFVIAADNRFFSTLSFLEEVTVECQS